MYALEKNKHNSYGDNNGSIFLCTTYVIYVLHDYTFYYYGLKTIFWQDNDDGPLLCIIDTKAQYSNDIPCPWLGYDNIKEKGGNPVSFASILMNYWEPRWVSTINIRRVSVFSNIVILQWYDRLMDQ